MKKPRLAWFFLLSNANSNLEWESVSHCSALSTASMKVLLFFVCIFLSLPRESHAQQSLEDSLNKIIAESKDEARVSRAYNALAYEYTRKDPVKTRDYL